MLHMFYSDFVVNSQILSSYKHLYKTKDHFRIIFSETTKCVRTLSTLSLTLTCMHL